MRARPSSAALPRSRCGRGRFRPIGPPRSRRSAPRSRPLVRLDLAAVLLDGKFRVLRGAILPFEVVQSRAVYVESVKAWKLMLRDAVWDLERVVDVTKSCARPRQRFRTPASSGRTVRKQQHEHKTPCRSQNREPRSPRPSPANTPPEPSSLKSAAPVMQLGARSFRQSLSPSSSTSTPLRK